MRLKLIALLVATIFIISACGASETTAPATEPASNSAAEEELAPTATTVPAVSEEETVEATTVPVEEEVQEEQTAAETEMEEMDDENNSADSQVADTETAEDSDMADTAMDEADDSAAGGENTAAEDIRTFVVVPEETSASYIVEEEFLSGALDRLGIEPGLVDTIGRTQEVTGEMVLDFNNLAQPVVSSEFSVDLRALTSDQPRRDNRIREANLESNRFPFAVFTITAVENGPASYSEGEEITFQATGDITIREITQPATFDVTARLEGNTITGVARAPLKMSDFGFEPPNFANMFTVEDEFIAEVAFVFEEES
jgi:polyisoprenoid-binding protein YceI